MNFGNEKGNFKRIARTLKKGIFVYPCRKDANKACVYVKDLCRPLAETEQEYCCYNLCYPGKTTIEDICRGFHAALGYGLPRFKIPHAAISAGAAVLRNVDAPFIRGLGLDPERIAKLVNSTNISSRRLVEAGFAFRYDLVSAVGDWKEECKSADLC
jgi:hypothetical protein